MKKLTAEKCAWIISQLNKDSGLSQEDSYQLQALEIALPILEQQERREQVDILSTPEYVLNEKWNAHFGLNQQPDVNPQADEGEWVEWGGGECPVDTEVVVSVKYRGDKWAHQEGEAAKFDWRHRGWCADTDIIAYRIIPERATNQNGGQ